MGKLQIVAEPGVPQVVMTREFDAPPELLLRAFTDPHLIDQWFGPRRFTTSVEYLEARDGGRWRFINRDADGNEFGFRGVFHGAPTVDGVIQTWEYEGMPGHVSLQTMTFEPHADKTVVRTNAVYQSVEDRDGHLQSGMESGANESMDRLEELIAGLAAVR
jgi:uncharacterized protein YndB with AHSA1/START domain